MRGKSVCKFDVWGYETMMKARTQWHVIQSYTTVHKQQTILIEGDEMNNWKEYKDECTNWKSKNNEHNQKGGSMLLTGEWNLGRGTRANEALKECKSDLGRGTIGSR
jgi:hypothetical protein